MKQKYSILLSKYISLLFAIAILTKIHCQIAQTAISEIFTSTPMGWIYVPSIFTQTSQCNGSTILGGFNKFGNKQSIQKDYDLSGLMPFYAMNVTVEVYIIGQWNGEQLTINFSSMSQSNAYYNNQNSPLSACSTSSIVVSKYNVTFTAQKQNTTAVRLQISDGLSNPLNISSWGINSVQIQILLCDSSCAKCVSFSSMNCTSCNTGKFLYQSECLSSCPLSTTIAVNGTSCIVCDANCQTCTSTTATSCILCKKANFFQYNGTCLSQCPQSTFILNLGDRTCTACDISCLLCNGVSSSQCLSCQPSFFSLVANNNTNQLQCVQICPQQYYPLGQNLTCQKCDATCLQCSGPSTTQCTKCQLYSNQNLDPIAHTCSNSCMNSKYADTNYICQVCDISCVSCNGPSSQNCQSCPINKLFLKGECLSSCPTTKYFIYQSTCVSCYASCLTCITEQSDQCTSCDANFYKKYQVSITDTHFQCVDGCGVGFFISLLIKTCMPCDISCFACTGAAANNCTSCQQRFFNASLNTCDSNQCIQGFYPDTINWVCHPCNIQCLSCVGPTNCIACQKNSFLYQNICQNSCPANTFSNSLNVCVLCDESCQTCLDSNNASCIQCNLQYYASSSTISVSTKTKTCLPCIANCQTCSSATTCDACFSGFLQQTNSLTPCIQCPAYCIQCSSEKVCLTCNAGYFLNRTLASQTTCTQCAGEGYVTANINGNQSQNCLSCPLHCVQCTDPNLCTTCEMGYSLGTDSNVQSIRVIPYGECLRTNTDLMQDNGALCGLITLSVVLFLLNMWRLGGYSSCDRFISTYVAAAHRKYATDTVGGARYSKPIIYNQNNQDSDQELDYMMKMKMNVPRPITMLDMENDHQFQSNQNQYQQQQLQQFQQQNQQQLKLEKIINGSLESSPQKNNTMNGLQNQNHNLNKQMVGPHSNQNFAQIDQIVGDPNESLSSPNQKHKKINESITSPYQNNRKQNDTTLHLENSSAKLIVGKGENSLTSSPHQINSNLKLDQSQQSPQGGQSLLKDMRPVMVSIGDEDKAHSIQLSQILSRNVQPQQQLQQNQQMLQNQIFQPIKRKQEKNDYISASELFK